MNEQIFYLFTINYFQSSLIEEKMVIFVCATTGQGDPPDNMKVLNLCDTQNCNQGKYTQIKDVHVDRAAKTNVINVQIEIFK